MKAFSNSKKVSLTSSVSCHSTCRNFKLKTRVHYEFSSICLLIRNFKKVKCKKKLSTIYLIHSFYDKNRIFLHSSVMASDVSMWAPCADYFTVNAIKIRCFLFKKYKYGLCVQIKDELSSYKKMMVFCGPVLTASWTSRSYSSRPNLLGEEFIIWSPWMTH